MMPLISCTCVTHNRPDHLLRAVACFEAQSYQNKELIILSGAGDIQTQKLKDLLEQNPQIKMMIVAEEQISLGDLRNKAIEYSSGEYICQWDDDDWYHPDRITDQYQHILTSGRSGSVLDHIIMYDGLRRNAYVSCKRLWEGSILCRREEMISAGYEAKNKGEDSRLVYMLYASEKLASLAAAPQLYIYNYHGVNTWDHNHFKGFYRHSRLLADVCAGEVGKIVNHEYTPLQAVARLDSMFRKAYQ
ncbi:glycosyltransferase family 2 protein [Chitinophagaceae bacterium MMS25-I14]